MLFRSHTQFEALMREGLDAAKIADWWAVDQFYIKLVESLRYHIAQEEEVLFPAYEKNCESSHMPTLALYNEHSVMVDFFRKLKKFIDSRSFDDTCDCIEALELLLIEHNKKEEDTFLPFASRLLFDDRDILQLQLQNFIVTNKSRHWGIELTEK